MSIDKALESVRSNEGSPVLFSNGETTIGTGCPLTGPYLPFHPQKTSAASAIADTGKAAAAGHRGRRATGRAAGALRRISSATTVLRSRMVWTTISSGASVGPGAVAGKGATESTTAEN